MCTDLDDAACLAAFVVCIIRMLYRLRKSNQRWRIYVRLLIAENRWRAIRYGADEGLIDFGKGEIVPFHTLLEELLQLVQEDVQALDCAAEVAFLLWPHISQRQYRRRGQGLVGPRQSADDDGHHG